MGSENDLELDFDYIAGADWNFPLSQSEWIGGVHSGWNPLGKIKLLYLNFGSFCVI